MNAAASFLAAQAAAQRAREQAAARPAAPASRADALFIVCCAQPTGSTLYKLGLKFRGGEACGRLTQALQFASSLARLPEAREVIHGLSDREKSDLIVEMVSKSLAQAKKYTPADASMLSIQDAVAQLFLETLERDVVDSEEFAKNDAAILEALKPALERIIRVQEASGAANYVVNEATRELIPLTDDHAVVNAVTSAIQDRIGGVPSPTLLAKAEKLFKAYSVAQHVTIPTFVNKNDEVQYCIRRFEEDPAPGPHPTWDGFLSRTSDPIAICAFIGAVLDPEDEGRESITLVGSGNDGKSAISKAITKGLGGACVSLSDDYVTGDAKRWWGSSILHKRLVIITDTKNPKLMQNGRIHRLTGGDIEHVEHKGERGFQYQPRTRLLITSNPMPEISSDHADASRTVIITVERSKVLTADFQKRLEAELPAFFYTCQQAWANRPNVHNHKLPLKQETIDLVKEVGEQNDDTFRDIFDEHFVVGEGFVPNSVLTNLCKEDSRVGNNKSAFRKYMIKRGAVVGRKTDARGYDNLQVRAPGTANRSSHLSVVK